MTTPPAGLRQRRAEPLSSWFDATFPDPTQVRIDRMRADVARWSTPEATAARATRRAAEVAAGRCYMAALAQVSRPADPAQRKRLVERARASLAKGDRVMLETGQQPERHPRRAMVLQRFKERGIE